MVPGRFFMKKIRFLVPLLGIIALIALFLKLPEMPNLFGIFKCTTCASNNPYLLFVGVGYFAMIVAVSLLFPTFPKKLVAQGGLLWALLLAGALTYINWPNICIACIICHMCNIVIWSIWTVAPSKENASAPFRGQELCLMLFAPISVVALFSCLNLTFMAYGFDNQNLLPTALKKGDKIPALTMETSTGLLLDTSKAPSAKGIIYNFISSDCPYCKEQLPILGTVAEQLGTDSYRFINISPKLSPELIQYAPATEWVEDSEGSLRKQFKVAGYPTLFVVKSDRKITKVIPGVSGQWKDALLASLSSLQDK